MVRLISSRYNVPMISLLDDKWLEVTPAELDHMIEQVQGIKLAKQV